MGNIDLDYIMDMHEKTYERISNALSSQNEETNAEKLCENVENTVKKLCKDVVNHPEHYTYGSIECIDYLDAIGVGYNFCRGNVIKYTTRLGHKVDDLEDAKKVVWYAQHIVDKLTDGTYSRSGDTANDS